MALTFETRPSGDARRDVARGDEEQHDDPDDDDRTSDWRTFRVDRFSRFEPTKRPSADRTPPTDDIEAYVVERIGVGMQRQRGVVRVHAPRAAVQQWIDPAWGRVEDLGDDKCVLHVGADSLAAVARWLLLLDADLTVLDPPALAAEFAALAGRATRAADCR